MSLSYSYKPPEGVEKLKKAVLSGPRSNMPYRVLKAVVDMMGRRYVSPNPEYEPLTLEEILSELGLTDLRTDTREWLLQVRKGAGAVLRGEEHAQGREGRAEVRDALFCWSSGSQGEPQDHVLSCWGEVSLQGRP